MFSDNFKAPVTKSEYEQIEKKAGEITKQSETENINMGVIE